MQSATECPKCHFTSDAAFSECPKCGIILEKFLSRQQQEASETSPHESDSVPLSDVFENASSLKIKQQKEMMEILTGFETRNRYDVSDQMGRFVFSAEEESGTFLTKLIRFFLKAYRPFTLYLYSEDGTRQFTIRRPFRFYFFEVSLEDSFGHPMGTIKKRFSFMRRIYSVFDATGREIYELFGPIFRPWTFEIRENDLSMGTITKKWSGLLKEAFTDADTFGIQFPDKIDVKKKAILLGAVFLIDQVHFENKGN